VDSSKWNKQLWRRSTRVGNMTNRRPFFLVRLWVWLTVPTVTQGQVEFHLPVSVMSGRISEE
jgi:hypothetical protein